MNSIASIAVARLAAVVALSLFVTASNCAQDSVAVAPFAATPTAVVDAMLTLARVGPDDFAIDLGSGDGRLVLAMDRLQRKLLAEPERGTRVVSHDYPFPSWRVERVLALDVPEMADDTGRRSTAVYRYIVPPRP